MSNSSDDSPWRQPGRAFAPHPAEGAEIPAAQAKDLPGYEELLGRGPSGQAGTFSQQAGPFSGQAGNQPGTAHSGSGPVPPGAPYYIYVPGGQGGGYGGGMPPWGPLPEKLPFRKRRPFIFWGAIILVLLLGVNFAMRKGGGAFPTSANIAVIEVEGMILDSRPILKWIETVGRDPAYKAAVVRINSPGGAVAPSQEIYQAVKRLSLSKPVAVSMADMAASGGYYVAVAGQRIFASPSTLTASIGVRMEVPNLQKLMETIGISSTTLTTGRLKDAGSYMRPMTPEEEAYLQGLIDDMYLTFLEAVADGRGMTVDQVRPWADGRAMTGRQALQAKLIDEVGTLEDAVAYAAVQAGISPASARTEFGPQKEEAWLRSLLGALFDLEAEYKARSQKGMFLY